MKMIVVFAAAVIFAIIAITAGMKIRKVFFSTPEDAVDSFFADMDAEFELALKSETKSEDDESSTEIAKAVWETLKYKIVSVNEKSDTAFAEVEIETIDMKNILEDTLEKALENSSSGKEYEKDLLKIIRRNKNKTQKNTVTLELSKSGKKWKVDSSIDEILNVLFDF